MYKTLKIIDKHIGYDNIIAYVFEPPRSWINFVTENHEKYQTFEDINELLCEYNAQVIPVGYSEDRDRYLEFETAEGYTEFMLRWG